MTETDRQTDRFVVSVTSIDRVGIVRDLAGALAPFEGNIESVKQTVLMNYFTLTVIVKFAGVHAVDEVKALIESAGEVDELAVTVKAFAPDVTKSPVVRDADTFILTAIGADHPGIISHLANYLAGKGINITDLYAYKNQEDRFVIISEVAVPRQMDASQIQLDIDAMAREEGLAVTLQHENIFKATNDIAAPAGFSS